MTGCGTPSKPTETSTPEAKSTVQATRPDPVTSGEVAKQLLVDGNARFVAGSLANKDLGPTRRAKLSKDGQTPFAVIVSCSDSRVPPEEIFDQGLGDIFVIRVAGNVLDAVSTGSVEYAIEHCKSPLVVVLGHEKCGAVTAAVKGGEAPGSIGTIVKKIEPSVAKAKAANASGDQLIEKASELNVEATLAELEKSPVVKELVEQGKVTLAGAKYDLDTGKVEWLSTAKE